MRASDIRAALYCGAMRNQHSMFSRRLSALVRGNDRKCCRALQWSEAHLYPAPFGAAAFMIYQEMILLPSGLTTLMPLRQLSMCKGCTNSIRRCLLFLGYDLCNCWFPKPPGMWCCLAQQVWPYGGGRTFEVLPACRAGVSFCKCMHLCVLYFGLALCMAVLQGEVSNAGFSCPFMWKLLKLQVA